MKVRVHAGVYYSGGIADPLYKGCNQATDSIVVSVAYRLGPFGYLALESADIYGNSRCTGPDTLAAVGSTQHR